ncbi:snRNA-activating protein complex subunit 3, putative [Plasmodium sp. DRC-Itaito]|nr:snRNA-activating protein complex subunit 3, putative [Plasmodium sp. DRC-Itaito]
MDDSKYFSFQIPIPHFSIDSLFNKDEFDFYKIKYKDEASGLSTRSENDNSNDKEKQEEDCADDESENEKLFMKYLKNIVRKGNKVNSTNWACPELNEEGESLEERNDYVEKDKMLEQNNDHEKYDENGELFEQNYNNNNDNNNNNNEDVHLLNKKQRVYNKRDNEMIKKNLHLFEKYPNIPIKKELENQWIYQNVKSTFNIKRVRMNKFKEECDKIRKRLKGKYYDESCEKENVTCEDCKGDKCTHDKSVYKKEYIVKYYNYLIKILLSGIRNPNIHEIINHIVYYNCNNWQYKIDMNILKKIADINTNEKKILNRTKCYIEWLPKMENNTFNKYQIISKLKQKTISKTFKLVCDFNNTLLKALYINQNLIHKYFSHEKNQIYNNNNNNNNNNTNNIIKNLSSNDIFIISVCFYHPIRGIKIAEYEILSNQTLANLTDVFFCFDTSNYGLPKCEGSLYFIDGILYPDLRSNNAVDYSTSIIHFYKMKKIKTNFIKYPYKINQDKAILNQIEIPLFKKCCFLHQGTCEHRVIFNNIRQYNKLRDKHFSKYPLRTFKPNISNKYCISCHKNIAQKIILDSYLLKENPSYMCNKCFDLFLMDKNNQPIDPSMKYFDYIDDV